MAVLVSDLVTQLDTNFRDSSTNSISAAERRQALTEATVWLMENTLNDHMINTYSLNYAYGVFYYKINSAIADFLEPSDLRRAEDKHTMAATRKSPRELAEDIANESSEFAFAIERKDGNTYAVINLTDSENIQQIATFDSTTSDGGTWAADTTNSDATNVAANTDTYKQGAGSLSFDLDVSQSGNNRATISGTTSSFDLSAYLDHGYFIFWMYIPDSTYTSSVTLYWGSDSSNYWSVTATTDAEGNAIADGWNKFSFAWADATKTSSPDESAIDYIRIDLNYTGSQGDDTGYLIDDLMISEPETLTFYYLTQAIGTDTNGTNLYAYAATTDIPYFSGVYDNYKFAVCHKAAEILFRAVGLQQDADYELMKANESLKSKKEIFPTSAVKEAKSFKVKQLNFNRRKY